MSHGSFGDLLRTHRLKLGLTQEGVAERAGLSVHAIQKLERGTTHPYRDTTKIVQRRPPRPNNARTVVTITPRAQWLRGGRC